MFIKKEFLFLSVLFSVIMFNLGCGDAVIEDNEALSRAKEIISFKIGDKVGIISESSVLLTLNYEASLTDLIPLIVVSKGAIISPASGLEQDFTEPVIYTVTAEDGTEKIYLVTVETALADSKEITSFTINGVSGVIDDENNSIELELPCVDLTNLTPVISITGVLINPASGFEQDFTEPVVYTVTAEDGTEKIYLVTVETALADSKEITSFIINGVSGVIDDENNSIELELPCVDLTNLTPVISITGVLINPASGFEQDFTEPVVYTVTAEDSTTREYTVTVIEKIYSIGDAGPAGGKIFYENENCLTEGWTYLESALSDSPSSLMWQEQPYFEIGATAQGTEIGTGKANTEAVSTWLRTNGQTTDRATIYCDEYSFGGYNDWFLPSEDELNEMYDNKVDIGGFINYFYWSSSEYSENLTVLKYFVNGLQVYGSKDVEARVRCIRSF